MFGWFRAAAAFASVSKRNRRSGSIDNTSGRTLMATSRSSRESRARYTSPMLPAPRGERISYWLSFVPGGRGIRRHYSLIERACYSDVSALSTPPEPNDVLPVTLRRTPRREGFELMHGFSFDGYLRTHLAAGIGLKVKRLGHRRRATHI